MLFKLRKLTIVIVTFIAMMGAGSAFAQIPGAGSPAATAPTAPASVADPLGRETPAGMIAGFLAAASEQNYERAAEYLDLSKDSEAWGPNAARQLQKVLDRGGYVYSRLRLSAEPAGSQDDGLMPNEERFGSVRTKDSTIDLLASRVTTKTGQIWLVSSGTVAELPRMSRTVAASLLDDTLPDSLREARIAGAPVGDWLAILVLAALSYGLAWSFTAVGGFILFRFRPKSKDSRFRRVAQATSAPIRLLLTAWILWISTILVGVSIVARQQFASWTEVLGWVALAWIFWRVIDALAEYAIDRLVRHGSYSMLSAVHFARRSVKTGVVVVAGIAALDAFGFNVTAGLAALGIGGIAIALGAQKTIENFVGSLTLVADQPVRVGDFCKFGETVGTVEDIGMRSTRIRTLDRTVVAIPNGQFASMQIENYTRRDKFWFHPILELRYETSADQVQTVLSAIREILADHEKIEKPGRVRLIELAESSLKIEVFAYVYAVDFDRFLEVQEELTLKIMGVVERAGAGFAFASRTVYFARDRLPSAVAAAADTNSSKRQQSG